MMWYLLKTWAGREEELVKEIRRTVPPYMYQEVFVIENERIWRRQGSSLLHREPLFKGCVFLTCREPEPLFRRMARVPSMAMLMASGNLSMFPLMEKDAEFLEQISGTDHVVRVSYLLREEPRDAAGAGPEEGDIVWESAAPRDRDTTIKNTRIRTGDSDMIEENAGTVDGDRDMVGKGAKIREENRDAAGKNEKIREENRDTAGKNEKIREENRDTVGKNEKIREENRETAVENPEIGVRDIAVTGNGAGTAGRSASIVAAGARGISGTFSGSRSVYRVSGALAGCLADISCIEFHKRFVKIEKRLWGEDKTIALGILLNEDIRRDPTREGAGSQFGKAEQYGLLEIRKDAEGRQSCREIRRLAVVAGGYEEKVKVG